MPNPTYPTFPIFAFTAFVLVLIPLPWHFQAWNSGTCLYMIWTAIGCLNYFINSIIWHGNAIDWAPIWCDISTRLTVGLAVAIPAASLCINRRLYNIASVQAVSITRAQKMRAIMIDLAIGLGIPALQMALQFIVQGHRYNIFEDIGCLPTTFNTPPAYPLSFVWPLTIGLVSAIYCILTLRAFILRRAQFSQLLSSNSSLTPNRYFRLMALASTELVFNTPINAYGIFLNITGTPIQPWRGWADAHFDWYTIDTYPAILWRSNIRSVVTLELSRWSIVFCALVFFAFFGFAAEARKNYYLIYSAVARRLGVFPRKPDLKASLSFGLKGKKQSLPMSSSVGSVPVYISKPISDSVNSSPTSKRDSLSSTLSTQTDRIQSIPHSPFLPNFKVHTIVPPSSSSSTSDHIHGYDSTLKLEFSHAL